MELNHNLYFSIGDPGCDGHNMSKDYHLVSNYSAKEIEEAYRELVKELHWDFTEECHLYEENSISEEGIKILLEYGIINQGEIQTYNDRTGDEVLDYEVDGPNEFVDIFFELVKLKLKDLKWEHRDLNEELIIDLEGAGYGLFHL